ncbi:MULTISPECIES: alpha/beta fold hydrolase [Pectobacterium]|uniref:alpha/beta fold hydrolase n=1 Tax=Pectobacterium TaxID=122277 RepID=UPI001F11E5F3|nr:MULTISPECIES: alpha/beta hydrolase [Pectobacterium]
MKVANFHLFKVTMAPFEKQQFSKSIDGIHVTISAITRHGEKAPIVFLHGFGSTKEDYADIVLHPDFDGHPFLAYDAPGCGETQCNDVTSVSIPFLVKTAISMLDAMGFLECHLVGHSMGGLTALLLADQNPERVLSFTNIEGNIAPEDCFLSRQIINYPSDNAGEFFEHFIERTRFSPYFSSALYAANLPNKVHVDAVKGIFSSMVHLSDHGALMDKFLKLPCPKMFMFGEQNRSLSYLENIEKHGVLLAEVSHCGHFPMYSNPSYMWEKIAENIVLGQRQQHYSYCPE